MPVVIVYGVPIKERNDNPHYREDFARAIQQGIVGVKDLGIRLPDQVSVFFPTNKLQLHQNHELVCFLEGLFCKPKRTHKVRQHLAGVIRDVLQLFAETYVPECHLVEVFVRQFDPKKDCFSQATW